MVIKIIAKVKLNERTLFWHDNISNNTLFNDVEYYYPSYTYNSFIKQAKLSVQAEHNKVYIRECVHSIILI